MQLMELNDRFSEANTDLLLSVACLCPDDSFSAFDKHRLINLARFYPQDFSTFQIEALDDQLETYILDMRSTDGFGRLKVERVFSAMNIIKNRLRGRMGDQWMNDSLVVYIEKEIFDSVDNESIMQMFQSMKTRRFQL
ncbi:uncharacterized protein LOC131019717 isoform X2 [Salvia miltiorrhiza]|uniref:uncharacterized protein LOC131019717 isoform X2 n=1 Tax=Salvia miltiorrhiza TaxID=226208 RepID=UPI0025ABC64B|nr:uncharacterized protein LOC131019717 isoform X2 [Salvia miltiorrhiza]